MQDHLRMRAIRKEAGETQKDIAEILQIQQQQYQVYESGKRQMPVNLLQIFCQHYHVSADEILGLNDPSLDRLSALRNSPGDNMELKDRIRLILEEQHIRQKDFARAIKVTESYVSNMLKGKRCNISESLAVLIEQLYGYSAQWLLTGEGERCTENFRLPELSPVQRKMVLEIQKMPDAELNAVQVFIDSLDEYKKAFGVED